MCERARPRPPAGDSRQARGRGGGLATQPIGDVWPNTNEQTNKAQKWAAVGVRSEQIQSGLLRACVCVSAIRACTRVVLDSMLVCSRVFVCVFVCVVTRSSAIEERVLLRRLLWCAVRLHRHVSRTPMLLLLLVRLIIARLLLLRGSRMGGGGGVRLVESSSTECDSGVALRLLRLLVPHPRIRRGWHHEAGLLMRRQNRIEGGTGTDGGGGRGVGRESAPAAATVPAAESADCRRKLLQCLRGMCLQLVVVPRKSGRRAHPREPRRGRGEGALASGRGGVRRGRVRG